MTTKTIGTKATNAAYERTMRTQSKDKWQQQYSDQTDATDSPHHFNKRNEALPKVS